MQIYTITTLSSFTGRYSDLPIDTFSAVALLIFIIAAITVHLCKSHYYRHGNITLIRSTDDLTACHENDESHRQQ